MKDDPYKYFRPEAVDLHGQLARSALDLQGADASHAMVASMLRVAHTLKGAARVVKQTGIADAAHEIEELLAPHRAPGSPLPPTSVSDAILKLADSIREGISRLGAPAQAAVGTPATPATVTASAGTAKTATVTDVPLHTGQQETSDVDALLEGLAEIHFNVVSLNDVLAGLNEASAAAERVGAGRRQQSAHLGRVEAIDLAGHLRRASRQLSEVTGRLERELTLARDRTEQLRLLPVQAMSMPLERTVRDIAGSLGKRVDFSFTGGGLKLEHRTASVVQAAMVQAARNAIVHGIELPAARLARGKPEAGRVTIEFRQRGSTLTVTCQDDGEGVNTDKVRAEALRKGLVVGDARGLGSDELVRLLVEGGISTSANVSSLSGRGIGMDVIRDAAKRLGGHVKVDSNRGAGTTIEVTVPMSLSSVTVLAVRSRGESYGIPLQSVSGAVRFTTADVTESTAGQLLNHGNTGIPLAEAAAIVSPARWQDGRGERLTAVLVKDGLEVGAFVVDRILGVEQAFVRPLPSHAASPGQVVGASLDLEGRPRLVLDPSGMISALHHAHDKGPVAARAKTRVMVIDDSITTRMLEQSILESAGYLVTTANSAEEGLLLAHDTAPKLFLVDVDMPGMSGFEFVEAIRKDPVLKSIPAILVTSRNSPEDFKRGKSAGAQGHIVKGDFNQTEFLAGVERLLEASWAE